MFTKDFVKPEPARPMIPQSVLDVVREAQAAGRRAEEKANLNMPFRARLRAREAVRPQSTLAIISGIQARPPAQAAKARPFRPAPPSRAPKRAMRAAPGQSGPLQIGRGGKGLALAGGGHDDDGGSNRLGDMSQFAFAGLAVLGLAGLSFMAADSALNGGFADQGGGDGQPDTFANGHPAPPAGDASVAAMAVASTPVGAAPVQWFDYRKLADTLAAQKASFQAAAAESAKADAAAARQAKAQAATAIAEAEAARLAEEARLADDAEAARLAEAEREKARLAEAEAARVAEAEAKRLADLKAEQDAAAVAEAKRLADIEARRVAAAEAEAQRVAALKAKAARETEQVRLASMAAAETIRPATVVPTPTPTSTPRPRATRPTPHVGPIPTPASLKPARPADLLVAASAPDTYRQPRLAVRPLAPVPASPRTVDAFLAERAGLTAAQPFEDAALDGFRSEFLRRVAVVDDGVGQSLTLPDGREMTILFERTFQRETAAASVRPIVYTGAPSDRVISFVSDVVPETVTVNCRDVAYAFPGQERGRFAACESPTGGWTLARASDPRSAPQV